MNNDVLRDPAPHYAGDATLGECRGASRGRALHILAIITALAILPLMLVGAGVTSKGAGMAFPDWPTSNSHFINPPGWLQDEHKLWEHGHRLIGWFVGMLAIGLATLSWPKRGWIRTVGVGTLLAIIVQGVLGGLRVTEISTELAMIHGIWGQVCFSLACITVLMTSRAWNSALAQRTETASAVFFQRTALVATICLFLQLATGAAYRHFGNNLALAGHLIWAAVVILLLCFVAMWAIDHFGSIRMISALGKALVTLIGVQMFLGGGALLVKVMGGSWPALIAWSVPSAHVVVGALLLACMVVLTLCAYRVLAPVERAATSDSITVVST